MSAEPERLVLMLYRGALKFINAAILAIEEDEMEIAHVKILRAHAIVSELMATLDFEEGGEIAENLELTYDYVLHLLTEADVNKDPSLLETAAGLIEPLAEAWEETFFEEGPAPEPDEEQMEQMEEMVAQTEEAEQAEQGPEPGKSVDLTG